MARQTKKTVFAELRQAQARVAELQATIEAIRSGAVDAVIVSNGNESKVFTLKGADEVYRVLLEQMSEGAATIGPDGLIMFCNRRFAEMVQSPPEAVVGSKLERYLPARERLHLKAVLGSLSRAGTRFESMLIQPSGPPLAILISLAKLSVSSNPLIFLVATDITLQTEQKRLQEEAERKLEERVRQRTAELEYANFELESFSYSVSHDLRAPLRAISGFTKMLMEDFGEQASAEAKHRMQMILESAAQMAQLVDALLGLSRLGRQALSSKKVNPTEIVRHCIEELLPEHAGRDIHFDVRELPSCEADPVLLKQVFTNLLSNALKYTTPKKVADIEIGWVKAGDLRKQEEPGSMVPGICASEAIVYYVRDNGVGFDMRYADKLFSVFQRLHSRQAFEGTGVGLATAQRIVHRHGGRIWAWARRDQGATFYFTLGAASAAEAPKDKQLGNSAGAI
ncbi:MAG TPA: ATP-binding protein [Terriglobales bacterium]|nr:ATP-binding protein [Terriglobales bacterium]